MVAEDWPCGYDPECGTYEAAMWASGKDASWFTQRGPVYVPKEGWWPPRVEAVLGGETEWIAWVRPVPFYSSLIELAWDVVEHLRQQGWLVCVQELPVGGAVPANKPRAACELIWLRCPPAHDLARRMCTRLWVEADTAPEAICRAALLTEQTDRPADLCLAGWEIPPRLSIPNVGGIMVAGKGQDGEGEEQ